MKDNFSKFLLYASVYLISLGFTLANLEQGSYYLKPKPVIKKITFLPGVLDLRGVSSSILGIESEVDPKEVVKFVNIEREKVKSRILAINPLLEKAAQMRAEVILKYQNPSHQDPFENLQLDTVLPKVNYAYQYASENIALANGSSAGFVAGWMNSPSHRQNLLDPSLVETGVGTAYGKVGDYYVTIAVEIFAIPVDMDKFRGYNQGDIEKVKILLEGVNNELQRTKSLISAYGRTVYYGGWETILLRQKEILNQIYDLMLSGMPLEERHYILIQEYNQNWQKVPTS